MNDIDESRAPLLDHLLELRRRLLTAFAARSQSSAGLADAQRLSQE